jgi:hypothetical protein
VDSDEVGSDEVGSDEVRRWPDRAHAPAIEAAASLVREALANLPA